ncbi:hypothetical protein TNIN_447781 [Trichonephila inaurata madagascariensis]|uniref:Knottins-like domain-containing protein n=1 Tax=Trichonephila inaurata madagascariensis TaxID=2747483 RepID=A0A8X6IJC1_9ARAC|nr:hypothetical protein TNIN_447781 [Trichonephila inaurata madagascariensis]
MQIGLMLFIVWLMGTEVQPASITYQNMCPGNWNACDQLCKSAGRRGGYCAGLWSRRCTCVERKPSITSDVLPTWGNK